MYAEFRHLGESARIAQNSALMRRSLVLCLLLLAGCARAPQPRLAVVIVVDGLPADRLQAARPAFTSGMKRLLDGGAVATQCRYSSFNTETGPGHATISTGATPSVHGVPSNSWFALQPDGKAMIRILSASQPAPGAPETSPTTVTGPGRLRVPTLGDRLLARDPRAHVVSISGKDRAAVLMAGRDPRAAAYWYEPKLGAFTTSPAYDKSSPTGTLVGAVVDRVNRDETGDRLKERFGTTWDPLERTPASSAVPAYAGLEAHQYEVVGRGFPKNLGAAQVPYQAAILWSPIADRLVGDLAVALIEDPQLAIGRDDVPDLLWVSFSANDYVSHAYGPGSAEELDVLRSLDLEIGRLLDTLDAKVGRGRYLVAFSADHGFLPLPESISGRRADVDAMLKAANAAVDRTFGLPPETESVRAIEGCDLWLDRAVLARPGMPEPSKVLTVVEQELADHDKEDVETVIRASGEAGSVVAPPQDTACARASRVEGRSGDLFVVPRPGVLFDPSDGKGSSHGSPHEYDRHVPLVFWGSGVARGAYDAPVTPCDLAPTIASVLGLTLPDATGHALPVVPARAGGN